MVYPFKMIWGKVYHNFYDYKTVIFTCGVRNIPKEMWQAGLYYALNFFTTTLALWPPKPRELESAEVTVIFRAVLGT